MAFTETVVGIDSCRAGWFFVRIASGQDVFFGITETLDRLWQQCPDAGSVFIDMPIGLPANGKRECDVAARKVLGRARSSSVFPPPCRAVLTVSSYEEACRINREVVGKKLTRQAWNIVPKIRETDDFIENHPMAGSVFFESHPEICFAALSGGRPMTHSKKTEKGREERLTVLEEHLDVAGAVFNAARQRYLKKDLADDDILDALALAVSAGLGAEKRRTVPDRPTVDQRGLPMRIVYASADGSRLPVPKGVPGSRAAEGQASAREKDCLFCEWIHKREPVQTIGTVMAFRDGHPVTDGHLLIVPIRHVRDWFAMSQQELMDGNRLVRHLAEKIRQEDPTVSGFNIGTNAGRSAGQTVFHAHIHLIPRRDDDCKDPTGGVRGVIDGRRCYQP